MDIFEIVMKLNGPVDAVGEHYADVNRKENLEHLCDLADKILGEISKASSTSNRVEFSMKEIGEYAKNFLKDVHASYESAQEE